MGVSGDLGQFITPRRDRKCRGVTHVKNRRIQVYVFARCSESFSISRGFRIAKWFAQKFFNQKNKEAAMYFWKPFYITCSTCGHRNRLTSNLRGTAIEPVRIQHAFTDEEHPGLWQAVASPTFRPSPRKASSQRTCGSRNSNLLLKIHAEVKILRLPPKSLDKLLIKPRQVFQKIKGFGGTLKTK